MEQYPAEELVGWVVERAQKKFISGNVVNIEPALRERRYKHERMGLPEFAIHPIATELLRKSK